MRKMNANRPRNLVGEVLYNYRVANNVNQSSLAKLLGVSLQFISNIENSRAPLPARLIPNVSTITGVPVKTLAQLVLKSNENTSTLYNLATSG
jgi:transcriptional regulator with XRE-family HTH domain